MMKRDTDHRSSSRRSVEYPPISKTTLHIQNLSRGGRASLREQRVSANRPSTNFSLFVGIPVAAAIGAIAIAIVLGLGSLIPRLTHAVLVGIGSSNVSALYFSPVADAIREDLGSAADQPLDPSVTLPITFAVERGDNLSSVAARLETGGIVRDRLAIILEGMRMNLAASLQAGDYVLRRSMTPAEIVAALEVAPVPVSLVAVNLRDGLRIEQIAAYLSTLTGLVMDPAAFYSEARNPPSSLRHDYPWLDIPAGSSLEGFLASGVYSVPATITADGLIRLLLDTFASRVGADRLAAAADGGIYSVVTLASLVEREAARDDERALIAGVYANRATSDMLWNADPTVIYGVDTLALAKMPFAQWKQYAFWMPLAADYASIEFPKALAGFQTYQVAGSPPGPICTPTVASIDAALHPKTSSGYLYFVAIPSGDGRHAFSRTLAEHEANLVKYGYVTTATATPAP